MAFKLRGLGGSRRVRSPIALGWFFLASTLATVVVYPAVADRYAVRQTARLRASFDRLRGGQPAVADMVRDAFESQTGLDDIPSAAPERRGPYPAANPFDGIRRVETIENWVRVFNRCVEESPAEKWTGRYNKPMVGSFKLTRESISMLFAYEQFACVCLGAAILVAMLLFHARLGGELHSARRVLRGLPAVEPPRYVPGTDPVATARVVDLVLAAHRAGGTEKGIEAANASAERGLDYYITHGRLALAAGLVWALPTIGFIGTLRGLSGALSVSDSPRNLPETIAYLQIAFDSSLVALLLAMPLVLLQHLTAVRIDQLKHRLIEAIARLETLSFATAGDAAPAPQKASSIQWLSTAASGSVNRLVRMLKKLPSMFGWLRRGWARAQPKLMSLLKASWKPLRAVGHGLFTRVRSVCRTVDERLFPWKQDIPRTTIEERLRYVEQHLGTRGQLATHPRNRIAPAEPHASNGASIPPVGGDSRC